MRMGIMSSLMALLAGASAALAQPPEPATPPLTAPGGLPPVISTAPVPSAAPASGCTSPACGAFADGGGPPATGPVSLLPDYGPGFGPAPMGNTFYGSAEYLLWKIKDAPLPPTQLTVPFTVTGFNQFTNSFSLANGNSINYSGRSGGRFTAGFWVHPDQLLGIEATYFQFSRNNNNFSAVGISDLPLTATVIQNITVSSAVNGVFQTTSTQVPLSVSLPAELRTTVRGSTGPSNFWGTEINARSTRCIFGAASIDILGGFRYLEFDENLNLFENNVLMVANSNTATSPGSIPPNPIPTFPQPITNLRTLMTVNTNDSVTTRNQFYGAQVGASFDWWIFPRFIFSGWGKVGTGAMVETIHIVGNTTTVPPAPGTSGVTPGGILTPGTGFIDDSRTRYVVIPEFNLNIGYQVTSRLRMMVGYNFLYISNVARPGNQIGFTSSSTNISVSGTPTAATINSPSYTYSTTDLWAQGLTAGFQLRY